MAQQVIKKEPAPAPVETRADEMVIRLVRRGGGVATEIDGKQLAPDVIDIALSKIDAAIRRRFSR